jgi:hypothetical protein
MAKNIFGIDLRALAVFRIGLAAVLLMDLSQRASDIESHYTDFGLLNRISALEVLPDLAISLHLANGTFLFQTILFLIAFVFALFYLVGYRTRLSACVSWVLLISLQNRNPLILNNADTLLLSCLFWTLFLPTESRYSVDELNSQSSSQEEKLHFSMGGVALLVQCMSIYLFSFFHKTGVEWYPDGTALYYALHVSAYVTPVGVWFRESPFFLTGMTFGTLGLQLLGPVLMFMPVFKLPLRLLVISMFAFFNIGIFILMDIGFFPIISLVTLIPFIPKECWDLMEKWLNVKNSFDQLQESSKKEIGSLNFLKENGFKNIFVSGMLALVLFWNVANLPQTGFKLPDFVGNILEIVRMTQHWNMFSPHPYKVSGWYTIPGELRNGQPADVYWKKSGHASFDRPEYISETFKNERWRKYLNTMRTGDNYETHRLNFGRFLCRSWNRGTPFDEQLFTFQIHFTSEETLPDYQKPKTEKWVLWSHDCFAP